MTESELERYRISWQAEIDGAALYRALAEAEAVHRPQVARIYSQMADEEEGHAALWEEKLRAAGHVLQPGRPGWRTRSLAWLAKRFGPQVVLPTIVQAEQRSSLRYGQQMDAQEEGLPADERNHARILHNLARGTVEGTRRTGTAGEEIARLEGRHRAIGGNALRAAVLGANDGLVSNLSLVMGVAGAQLASEAILITGLAGLLAGASSMAMGEWLSVQSSRELYQRQIAIEALELEEDPGGEAEELVLIYRGKGIPENMARQLATQLMSDKGSALDTLVREELGIDPKELGGSAWQAAITSFVLFAIGAVVPVTPFILWTGMAAVVASLVASTLALFVIGAGITLLTGRSVLFSGMRQVLIGLAAAGLTFAIGRLIGVTIAG